jgi:putative NADH-flavin reductase
VRLLVVGASGRTGSQVVEQALGHGHEVVAFARDPSRLPFVNDRLTVLAGDVTDAAAVQAAVQGCDSVIATLGSHGPAPVSVYSDGIANTIRAMNTRGIRRLVVVSAAGVGADSASLTFTMRAMRRLPGLRPIYEDMERMEGDIVLSDLDWTIVRPPVLTDGPLTGIYRVVEGNAVPKGSRISRADLAAWLLKCAQGTLYSRRAVAIAY